jgi:hypothetical protein
MKKPKDMQWDAWTVVRMEVLVGLLSDILTPAHAAVEAIEAQAATGLDAMAKLAHAEFAKTKRHRDELNKITAKVAGAETAIQGALDHLCGLLGTCNEELVAIRERLQQ